MEIHICKICNKEFLTAYKHAEYCCDNCRKEASRRRDALRVRTGRRKKRKADYMTIGQIVKAASDMGISYGRYVSKRSFGEI